MISAIIELVPFILFFEIQNYRIRKREQRLPDFFRTLEGGISAGLALPRAIKSLPADRLGILKSPVNKLKREISWGYPSKAALMKFGIRTKSAIASSVMATITKSYEAGGNLAKVLNINSKNVRSRLELRALRFNQMLVYILIIYLTFGVYLITMYVLISFLISAFPQAEELEGFERIARIAQGVPYGKGIFFHAAMIQGFFSGLIAGKFGGGKVLGGLKHSLIMMSIAYLVFTLFII